MNEIITPRRKKYLQRDSRKFKRGNAKYTEEEFVSLLYEWIDKQKDDVLGLFKTQLSLSSMAVSLELTSTTAMNYLEKTDMLPMWETWLDASFTEAIRYQEETKGNAFVSLKKSEYLTNKHERALEKSNGTLGTPSVKNISSQKQRFSFNNEKEDDEIIDINHGEIK